MARKEGAGVLKGVNGRLVLASVEIKTPGSSSRLQRSTSSAPIDVSICELGDTRFKELIPEPHAGQTS